MSLGRIDIKRRQFLRSLGAGTGGLLLPGIANAQTRNELKIPGQLSGEGDAGRRHFYLKVQSGTANFIPGHDTPTIGINGDFLGPTLRFKTGDRVAMHVENRLAETTTLHWHGLHLPAEADGGPAQIINPGETWRPKFELMQKAGTFWYHSHRLNRTGEQVYLGMAGMIIVDDDETALGNLPATYGVDDIPLIVQDRRFDATGAFRYVTMHRDIMTGVHGDRILVNGTLSPVFTPTTSLVRFRLLYAANARTFNFAFDDGRRFHQIAGDGGLLASPLALDSVMLAPAERAEIVVDFTDRRPANLISQPMPGDSPFFPRGMMAAMHPMNRENLDVLAIRPNSGLTASGNLPNTLTDLPRIEIAEANRTRRFLLSMNMGMGMGGGGGRGARGPGGRGRGRGGMAGRDQFTINGNVMDMDVINERVTRGDTEIWELRNDSMMMHPFHIHHGQFQLLDRNGAPPPANELGYKDTVKVGPGEVVRFIMRFRNFSDEEAAYMYHCHILEHEDNGMMGQFVVV